MVSEADFHSLPQVSKSSGVKIPVRKVLDPPPPAIVTINGKSFCRSDYKTERAWRKATTVKLNKPTKDKRFKEIVTNLAKFPRTKKFMEEPEVDDSAILDDIFSEE